MPSCLPRLPQTTLFWHTFQHFASKVKFSNRRCAFRTDENAHLPIENLTFETKCWKVSTKSHPKSARTFSAIWRRASRNSWFVFATLTVFWRVDGDMAWSLEQSLLNFVEHSSKKNLNFNRLYAIWTFFLQKNKLSQIQMVDERGEPCGGCEPCGPFGTKTWLGYP